MQATCTAPGTCRFAHHADEILLVTTNELPAFAGCSARFETIWMWARIGRHKTKLVVNRYNRDVGLSKEVISTALKRGTCFTSFQATSNRSSAGLMEGKPISANSAVGQGGWHNWGDRLAGR